MTAIKTSWIVIRTEFEGFHHYPNAGAIDPRIQFLEHNHRHMFKVTVKIQVFENNRELEFFLCKWALNDFIKSGNKNNMSCEMIADDIIDNHLIPSYGSIRRYEVTVSEDGESDGIVEYYPMLQ